ncbi:MAG: hypothetical protein LBH51_05345 [Treponema sp.]|jgi:hypothetical protein|nr:hypothetical protein [Treponema sp.]
MKRWVLLLSFAGLLTAGVFADHPSNKVGVGLFLGGGWTSVGGGLFNPGVSLKVPSLPIYWGLNAYLGGAMGFSVAADYYLIDRNLVNDGSLNLDWFLGLGGFGHVFFGDTFAMALGVRLPIGLSWHISRAFELFLNLSPGVGVKFDSHPLYSAMGAELGFRVWI